MSIVPDRATFCQQARPGLRIAVVCELLADHETPLTAWNKLSRGESHAFLLESVEHGARAGAYSYVGVASEVASFANGAGTVTRRDGSTEILDSADPLDYAATVIAAPFEQCGGVLPRLVGGAVGYIGYECAALWERLPVAAQAGAPVPDALLMRADTVLAFDHARHRVSVVTSVVVGSDADAAYDRAVAELRSVTDCLRRSVDGIPLSVPEPVPRSQADESAVSNLSRDEHIAMVEAVKEYIAAGDAIQVVVSRRLQRRTDVDPVLLYRALRIVNPSPYMFLLRAGDIHIAGASPELLVQCHGDVIATHPIAGTRRRGLTPEEDEQLERELLADDKEQAEHAMLVDLGRNDIGRVSDPGTVRVDAYMQVERFSHVMHLTSRVEGQLRRGLHPIDAFRACFPAGTVSGAPKIRAMEIIAELESERRGVYAGAIGYFGFDGTLDTAIAIRTMVIAEGIAYVQAGGGIVADSNGAREYEETQEKARAVLRAIDLAEALERDRT